jgi:hypothetical protein
VIPGVGVFDRVVAVCYKVPMLPTDATYIVEV